MAFDSTLSVSTKFAMIFDPASALADEVVEVIGEMDGQSLVCVANGQRRLFVPAKSIDYDLSPIDCPVLRDEAVQLYRELIGAAPPANAPDALVWAAVERKAAQFGIVV